MRRTRCGRWDFNRFSPGKTCQKRVSPKKQLLMPIDLSMNAFPVSGLIVAQNRSFLKPCKPRNSHALSLEHAPASAAPAASLCAGHAQ